MLDRDIDFQAFDYQALTFEEREALRRVAIRRARAEREAARRKAFRTLWRVLRTTTAAAWRSGAPQAHRLPRWNRPAWFLFNRG